MNLALADYSNDSIYFFNSFNLKFSGIPNVIGIPCEAGFQCPEGSSSPSVCPEGFYCPKQTGDPKECPPGEKINNG